MELSDKASGLFEDSNILFVGTALDNGHITFNTAVGRAKERNLRRDPRVGLSVTATDDPFKKVDIVGRVVDFIEGDEADAQIDDLSEKYLGQRPYPWHRESEQRVKVVIEPMRVYEM